MLRDTPATLLIAALVSAVSVLLVATGLVGSAAIIAGFIPATAAQLLANPLGFNLPDSLYLLPAWVTPLTSAFIHGGFLHLVLNMVMLVYCGQRVERAVGAAGVVALAVLGAYAAAAGQWALDPHGLAPTIGASGAVSALVAAYAMLFAERPVPAIGPIPSRVVRIAWLAAAWIGIQALVSLSSARGGPVIAIGAHIGGFIAGLALARPLLLWRYRQA